MKIRKGDPARRVRGLAVVLAVSLCAVMGLAACAPQSNGESSNKQTTPTAVAAEADGTAAAPSGNIRMADYTDSSTGLFADVNDNAQTMNFGNRGCGACHTDLWDLNKDNGEYVHIVPEVGLKNANYVGDCQLCHSYSVATGGNTLSENIHNIHYSSSMFVDGNGNCWNCHIMNRNDDGTTSMELFDVIKYTDGLGGYLHGVTSGSEELDGQTDMRDWATSRGYAMGTYFGGSFDNDPDITVAFDQVETTEDQQWNAVNFKRVDGNDDYAIDVKSWTLDVTGLKDGKALTLDEIKAMPATAKTVAHWCAAVGPANTSMVQNMPIKGVYLKDFVEALGGPVAQGEINITFECADNWRLHGDTTLSYLVANDAMLVYEEYGHDLTPDQGAPLRLLIPTEGGNYNIKNLVGLRFDPIDGSEVVVADTIPIEPYTTWIEDDGLTGKVGKPFQISGAAWGNHLTDRDGQVAKVAISFDYGANWKEYDVPADLDPDQWVHFVVDWTPSNAGTYVLKVKAVSTSGVESLAESSLIVLVEE